MPKKTRLAKFGNRPSLGTPRFTLTEVHLDDAPELVPVFQDEDNQVHMGFSGDFSEERIRDLIDTWLRRGLTSSFWWKITDKATQKFMGMARFHDIIYSGGEDYIDDMLVDLSDEAFDHEEFSLDLMILPQYGHQGIGTEVTTAIIAFLFDQILIPGLRVELNPRTKSYKNAAHLCTKLGFKDQGRIGDHMPGNTDPNVDNHEFWLTKSNLATPKRPSVN